MKSNLLALLLLSALAGNAFCSDRARSAFRTLGVDVPEMTLQLTSGGKPLAVPVTPGTRSEPMSYKGPALMVFRQDAGGAAFSTELPPGGGPFLLLWTKAADGSVRLFGVLDESPEVFPAGATRVVNTSSSALGVRMGAERLDLPAGAAHVFPPPPATQRTQAFQVLRDGAGGTDAVFSNNWAANPSLRTLVVIGESGGTVTVRRFPELPLPAKR